MDIVSHGLWGGAAFGRKNKKSFWVAFLLGVLPALHQRPLFNGIEPPDPSLIPSYVGQIYNLTHSLVVFAAALLILVYLWFFVIKKRKNALG